MSARYVYFIHRNSGGAVFVKEFEFFKDQGGLSEKWGEAWMPVVASSIEEARELGEAVLL